LPTTISWGRHRLQCRMPALGQHGHSAGEGLAVDASMRRQYQAGRANEGVNPISFGPVGGRSPGSNKPWRVSKQHASFRDRPLQG